MVNVKEIASYKDYGKCLSVSNGVIEAYITLDVGPRIIRFGYVGGQNIMNTSHAELEPMNTPPYEDFFGKGKSWESYGGHRIWLSPESYPETYYPDCTPVKYDITSDGALFTPNAWVENGVQPTLEIKMDADDANMQVIMRVKNISDASKKFAIWGLTVSEKNGTVIIPMNDNDTGLLANRIISVWPYTDLSDERLYFGKKYITVKQSPACAGPMKLGFDLNCGSVYYVLGEDIFRKSFNTNHPDGNYPDGGCSFEAYTNKTIIEIESLSELKDIKTGESIEHTESWSLEKKPCEIDFRNDASIENMISKL